MKYLVLIIALTSCASSPSEYRRNKTLDCVKELIEENTPATEAYQVCESIYMKRDK
jgi:hypothetical protein